MSFRRDSRGFIFSLDATLAMLVVLIVMAGVARVGGPGPIYEQHGYLRLERYANDALEVMQLTGTLDDIVDLVMAGDNSGAENLARAELRKILPDEVQFKLVVGDNRLAVYPSDAGERANWDNAFASAKEIAVATRISLLKESIKVLAWLDDPLDENFMTELRKGTNWLVKTTSKYKEFKNEIDRRNPDGSVYYDVVFMPDGNTKKFSAGSLWKITDYSLDGGKLVFGGKTLWTNREVEGVNILLAAFGVEDWGTPPELVGEPEFNYMHISDDTDFITAPYYICSRIEYSGETYEQYVYQPFTGPISGGKVHVIAQWDNVPSGWTIDPTPWPGIISREAGFTWAGYTFPGQAVLFNMRFAQSAMDPDDPKGTEDWITLARRAIDSYEPTFGPITLYVWRGQGVS